MATLSASNVKIAWTLLLLGAIVDTLTITIIKMHMNLLGEIEFSSLSAMLLYAGRFLQFPIATLAFILLMIAPILPFIALSRIQLSLAYPILVALHLIFIEVFSYYLLNEHISLQKILGICCIFISILFFYKDSMAPAEVRAAE